MWHLTSNQSPLVSMVWLIYATLKFDVGSCSKNSGDTSSNPTEVHIVLPVTTKPRLLHTTMIIWCRTSWCTETVWWESWQRRPSAGTNVKLTFFDAIDGKIKYGKFWCVIWGHIKTMCLVQSHTYKHYPLTYLPTYLPSTKLYYTNWLKPKDARCLKI